MVSTPSLSRDAEEFRRRAADGQDDGFRASITEDVGAVHPSTQRKIRTRLYRVRLASLGEKLKLEIAARF